MMQDVFKWRVLAVDDDPQKLQELERILSTNMEGNEFIFTKATTFDEGMDLIDKNRFDLVFLDVHEEEHDPDPSAEPRKEDQRGEGLLRHLQSVRFLPVIFYTGYPSKVSHLESMVVRVVDKGAPIEKIRAEVLNVLNTKLPQLLRYIEEKSRSYMWESLDELLTKHEEDIDPSEVSLLLARRLAASLSQNVVKNMLDIDLGKICPLEMYQYPPIEQSCNPTDIYKRKNDDTLWMVFTPACDFEQDKAENVLLARIIPLVEHPIYTEWKQKASAFEALEEGNEKNQAKKEMSVTKGHVKSLIYGRKGERYRFLPGTFFLPDCVVDFQNLLNFPRADDEGFEVLCSLDNPYREELLNLFSKYYGRIGTPDYDSTPIWKKIEAEFQPN